MPSGNLPGNPWDEALESMKEMDRPCTRGVECFGTVDAGIAESWECRPEASQGLEFSIRRGIFVGMVMGYAKV